MSKPIVSEKLIVIDGAGPQGSPAQVIGVLCQRLQAEGYIDPGYLEAVLEREQRFPTALPTLPYATAIPHADPHHVRETGVAVAILDRAIPFRAMDCPEQSLPVRAVLLLAVADSARQATTLRWVCEMLSQKEAVERLVQARSPAAALAVLQPLLEDQAQGVCSNVRDR